MKTTPERIEELLPGQVFVFGSNEAGDHIGGAALLARIRFGAINGRPLGMQGRSFAVPTLDKNFQQLPISEIADYVGVLIGEIKKQEQEFLITEIGCGIAGFSVDEIAPLFRELFESDLTNYTLPERFINFILL